MFYPLSGLEGNLLRLPTLGVSFGVSSIAELQIDGGLYNRLAVTSRVPAPRSRELDFTGDTTNDFEDITIATKIRLAAGEGLVDRHRRAAGDQAAESPPTGVVSASTPWTSIHRC